MKKKYLFGLFLSLFTISLSSCSCSLIDSLKQQVGFLTGDYPEEQLGIRLSAYDKTYVIGETYNFYYYQMKDGKQVIYDNITLSVKGAKYSVEDSSVLSIDEYGHTEALKAGTTNVYLICEGAFTFKCKVTVEEKVLKKLEINTYRKNYYIGKPFNFVCEANAVYQNGFKELVTPEIDDSEVEKETIGTYTVKISYTLNGVTKSANRQVVINDASMYSISKTTMDYTLDDLERNSGAPMLPSSGNPKLLIIPVKFTDSNTYISNYDNVKEDIETVFFGSYSDIGYESVKTFYEKESGGKVSLTGTVSDWYESGKKSSQVYNSDANDALRNNAIEWFFNSNPSEDRTSYDLDSDGYLDGVVFVYGSLDRSTGGLPEIANEMWASVKSRTGVMANVSKPVASGSMWVSYDFLYPTTVKAFARTQKSDYAESPYAGKSMPYLKLDPFTFIHETGHLFGLSDYYSYSEDNVFYAGHANMQTASLLSHDPYSLMLLGWAKPYIPEFDQTISIGSLVDTHDFIMLRPDGVTGNSPFDEYILIDLYSPTGLNQFHAIDHQVKYDRTCSLDDLAYPGIRIWHIDARLANRNRGYSPDTLTTNPKTQGASYITDNSYGGATNAAYKDFVELELIRNDTGKQLRTLSFTRKEDLFNTGDTFDLNEYMARFYIIDDDE